MADRADTALSGFFAQCYGDGRTESDRHVVEDSAVELARDFLINFDSGDRDAMQLYKPCDVALLAATLIRLRKDADRLAELLKAHRGSPADLFFVRYELLGREHLAGPRSWNDAQALSIELVNFAGATNVALVEASEVMRG